VEEEVGSAAREEEEMGAGEAREEEEVGASKATKEEEAREEEEEDMSESSEAGVVAEWLGATALGELRVVAEDEHSVWGRREGERYMDHGGGDVENPSVVWVLRWRIFSSISIPIFGLGGLLHRRLEIG
jgi:hypothetical protein